MRAAALIEAGAQHFKKRAAAMPSHKLEVFQLPFPAWTAEFSGLKEIVFAQIGVQSKQANPSAFCAIAQTLDNAKHVDRAFFEDPQGFRNELLLAYWDSTESYASWLENPSVRTWREQMEDGAGKWLEVAKIPLRLLETLYASENHEAGMSHLASAMPMTDQHGYWGAMRDRITAAEEDALSSALPNSVLAEPKRYETWGKPLRVKAPDNLCFIRTAQDWSNCQGEESATYLETVAPVLAEGVRFLRDAPLESGCCAGRFLRECDLMTGEPLDKTCMAAYFLSLGHLEHWAKTHPSILPSSTALCRWCRSIISRSALSSGTKCGWCRGAICTWNTIIAIPLRACYRGSRRKN